MSQLYIISWSESDLSAASGFLLLNRISGTQIGFRIIDAMWPVEIHPLYLCSSLFIPATNAERITRDICAALTHLKSQSS